MNKNKNHSPGLKINSENIESEFVELKEDEVLKLFEVSRDGLSIKEAKKRLAKYGQNDPTPRKDRHIILEFISRLANPLVITLFVIALLSFLFGEKISAVLVSVMAVTSVVLSFIQEYRAQKNVDKLIDLVQVTTDVIRSGKVSEIKMKEVVPGDIISLSAGDLIPADLRIIFAKDLFVNQSSFTGESYPAEKYSAQQKTNHTSLSTMSNIVLMGSSVVSGTALGVVLRTGIETELGRMSQQMQATTQQTSFDKGVKDFTIMIIKFMISLALIVFIINAVAKGNLVEAFLFALAVAVGLAPEMLPMEVAINLSRGAIDMARKGVIVKRLDSIQNFGAMDILCTDKTGTLTMDNITLVKHINAHAKDDEDVLRTAYISSYFQTGLRGVLESAILKHEHMSLGAYKKIDEIPFDFDRRILSVIINDHKATKIITKGAPESILDRCNRFEIDGKVSSLTSARKAILRDEYDKLSADGLRVLAIAYNNYSTAHKKSFSTEDEKDLIFKGFVCFIDPPKPTVKDTILDLENSGIKLKILSGDNELVTLKICSEVGIVVEGKINGTQIEKLSDTVLAKKVENINIFTRLNPLQKKRIINLLQKNGHIVGYLGDGINDAPALKSADVGISVNNAVGIAKDTADIILLKKSLRVLTDCVVEGRKTFGNIVKYIKMGASSNFGNMFSMIGASLLLPFLPMLPVQILLNNFLYDFSQTSLPTDTVDEEYLDRPRPWNISFVKKFMVFIGPISSLFDYITFGVLWFVFAANTPANQALFQTGWFIESITTQTLVIYIIRTNKIPFLQSNPSKALVITTLTVLFFAYLLVNTHFGSYLGFTHLPLMFYGILAVIVITYLTTVQLVKTWFLRKFGNA